MAKGAAQDKDKADEEAKPKKGKKLLVIILIVVLLLVLVGGGLVGLLLMKRGGQEADVSETSAPASARVDLSRPPTFVALEAFTVNLAPDEGNRFLQVVMALRVADARTGDNLKGFMPEIRHRVNLLLSGKLPSEVATAAGRETLAREIADEINVVLGGSPGAEGPIQAVLFNSFIVQ
jgi:flagellar FliL protein